MAIPNWQLVNPMDAVVFDCDGTLSTIEGIDELAQINGVYEPVQALTSEAMGKTGINPELYEKRLELVQPTDEQVIALGNQYFAHQVPDAANIIQLLKRLNKSIYLVSAGLYPAVAIFGNLLKIPQENIFAVNIIFDSQGNYLNFDHHSPFTRRDGKREFIQKLKSIHKNIIYVGDGLNDLAVRDEVTRFVGYGGAYYRQNIADMCQFYISTLSMATLLPLALTKEESEQLTANEKKLYQKGLVGIEENKVKISS